VKNLKESSVRSKFEEKTVMELKVFTLPTCPTCPIAKLVVSEVAQKLGIAYREVNMATKEGLDEGLTHEIISTPSIVIDKEVIVRGRLISREKLEEEVKTRLEKWKARAGSE
jgi:glutaredoxin